MLMITRYDILPLFALVYAPAAREPSPRDYVAVQMRDVRVVVSDSLRAYVYDERRWDIDAADACRVVLRFRYMLLRQFALLLRRAAR